MELQEAGPQPTLPEFLRARALASPPSRLVLDALCGGAGSGCAWWARPRLWVVLVSAGLCFTMYGVWAAAERRLHATAEMGVAAELTWLALRLGAGGLGVAAMVALVFAVLGAMLGTWIS
ncbi:MAG: hypothetical protein ACYC7F_07395 [Gemmatimonadaceae bacterium]